MGNPVVHFEITAKGVDRLHDFYGKVFGWKIDANNPFKYGMTDTGAGSGINGGIGETTGTPHVTFYIQVASIDTLRRRVKPEQARQKYIERFEAFQETYRSLFRALEIHHLVLPTDADPGRALAFFLAQRQVFA